MKIHFCHFLQWIFVSILFLPACKPITVEAPQAAALQEGFMLLTMVLQEGNTATRNVPIEFTITGIPSVNNPFDPAEADLQINLLGPDGTTVLVGGFWYQPYAAGDNPQGEGGWRARFTPIISGEWRATAHFQPGNLTSAEVHFRVVDADNPGFVTIGPDNPRHFAYGDGTRFVPVGVNMGWWDDEPVEDYTRWLDHFAANGGNTIRVWMANWAFALEWNDTPLGDYRNRMYQAWLLDELFRLANERGIQVILVLNHHGQFSTSVNPQWQENPYNAELGGPLTSPAQFASDPIAIAYFKQRLRYIVDRWGAAPNLLAWEWWNEYNFTPIDDQAMAGWLAEVGPFLAARDPYNHLVTISGPAGPESPIWQLTGIDFVSVHIYSTDDPLHFAAELAQEYAPAVPDKPLLLAEFGFATGEETVDATDKTGIHLHNGLWAALFSGHAGTGMYWWWDTYIAPLDLWHHFEAITHFMESVDPADFTPTSVSVAAAPGGKTGAEALLLKSNSQWLLWARSDQYTASAVNAAYDTAVRDALRNKETLTNFTYTPSPVSAHSVQIEGVEAGHYEVEWFDPQTGNWGEVEEIEATNGTLLIPLPTFSHDIAAKITPAP